MFLLRLTLCFSLARIKKQQFSHLNSLLGLGFRTRLVAVRLLQCLRQRNPNLSAAFASPFLIHMTFNYSHELTVLNEIFFFFCMIFPPAIIVWFGSVSCHPCKSDFSLLISSNQEKVINSNCFQLLQFTHSCYLISASFTQNYFVC